MGARAKVTVEQFLAMSARGDFDPIEENHVELIRGEIVPRFGDSPRNYRSPSHRWISDDLLEWSYEVIPRDLVRVRVQSAISIPTLDSIPLQEVHWAARKDYSRAYPEPEDVFLLIEVSDGDFRQDRGPKLELYAEARLPDCWVVSLQARTVDVYRDPRGLGYRDVATYIPGQEIHPLAFPDVSLPVSRLFPE